MGSRSAMALIIAASIIASCMNNMKMVVVAEEAALKKGLIHVGGKVLCQDCTQGWNEWVNGAPIKGSKVSITCLDDRSRVVYYGSDLTDEGGDFEISVNKCINGKELKPKNCFLRLVSSPHPVCNIATDFGGGKSGVKLGRPAVVYRDTVKYILDPFYYTTPMCDDPETTEDGEDDGKGSKY